LFKKFVLYSQLNKWVNNLYQFTIISLTSQHFSLDNRLLPL